MALITMPTAGVADVSWSLDVPAQVNRSEITGVTKVLLQGGPRWSARVAVAVRTDDDVLDWRRFYLALRGRGNVFYLPAIKPGEQAAVPVATVTAVGGSTGGTLATTGWGAGSATVMKAGQMVSHADRLHGLVADVTKTSTLATLTLEPRLAAASVASAVVQVRNPVGTMRLAGNAVGWLEMLANYQPFAFECEEAW